MDQEIKRKWVEALRSGRYQQGPQKLYDSHKNTFCCLGVLGHVKGMRLIKLDGEELLQGNTGRCHSLPMAAQEGLAGCNDEGVPFDMIAGLIDEAL